MSRVQFVEGFLFCFGLAETYYTIFLYESGPDDRVICICPGKHSNLTNTVQYTDTTRVSLVDSGSFANILKGTEHCFVIFTFFLSKKNLMINEAETCTGKLYHIHVHLHSP